ncbi:BgTH12-03214 [Blumeria graminis f. sp. triticale]|uniref:protein disulfide-isomerase n=3 Tax=Blumeria graminis TaxID=34373 RepID=A0A061HQW8_BLUGR|nr:disulfide isomerase (PDI) family protein [Blumeria graminis f. sp. tritici 96224]CAD6503553.1 BgTH12-03214 [Blumeria graminis f. sp. triticale]VDB89692.1 Bgt-3778 [Blumeria graminis f. sp. tritici]
MFQLSILAVTTTVLLALPANADLYPKSSAVLSIDSKIYENHISKSNHTTILEFYAPWCGHCKNLQPAYEKAAERLKGLANVAAVNCDKESNKGFCARFGIEGFPTIKIIKPGKTPGKPRVEEYNGPRSAKGIVETVVQNIPNLVKTLHRETAEEWIKTTNESPRAILFTEKPKVSGLWKAIAIEFKGNVQFAQLQTDLNEDSQAKLYEITKLPTVLLLKPGAEVEKLRYDGEIKREKLVEFLSQVATPNPDPAPVTAKKDSTKADEAETTPPTTAQKPASTTEPAPTIPALLQETELNTECLGTKTGTCILVLLSGTPDKEAIENIGFISELAHKYKKLNRVLFPFYILPEMNPKYATMAKELSLDDKLSVIAVNGKRMWWRQMHQPEDSSTKALGKTLENWISSIQLGEGEKLKLPSGLVVENFEEIVEEKVEENNSEEKSKNENSENIVGEELHDEL